MRRKMRRRKRRESSSIYTAGALLSLSSMIILPLHKPFNFQSCNNTKQLKKRAIYQSSKIISSIKQSVD